MSADHERPTKGEKFAEDLRRAAEGDRAARRQLWAEHYETLRSCAKAWFTRWKRGKQVVSLEGTDVAHAAYDRLHDRTAALEHGKTYFFRAFYTECLRIVVEHYRKTRNDHGRGRLKRVDLPSQMIGHTGNDVGLEQFYEALVELEQIDTRVGQVAMLKIFESRAADDGSGGRRGLINAEVAELLGVGLRTVEKDWSFAKAWLQRRFGATGPRP